MQSGLRREERGMREYPQGMKWTRQRKAVYDVLLQAGEPLSAVQIYNQTVKNDASENYAVSTIYRILTAFEEKGFVSRSNWMGEGTQVYELERGSHTHYAICLSCHKHIPLHACPFEHVHLPESDGDFQITGHKLELYGYCKDCKQLPKAGK